MGIILAILTAFFNTAQNTSVKKAAIGTSDPIVITWAMGTFSLIVIVPLFLALNFFYGIVQPEQKFWMALATKMPLMVTATLCYVLAHKHGDMSLVNPLLSLTPVVVLILAPFTIQQQANIGGTVGVFLIVLGAYALNFTDRKAGYLEPIKMLFRDKGARYMMITATIWGITTIIDAVGVQSAGGNRFQAGVTWAFYTSLLMALILTPFVIRQTITIFKSPIKSRNKLLLAGVFTGLMESCQMIAMTMLLAAYVNAIKRFSMVLSVIVGAILGEQRIKERLAGSLIMLAGIVMIVLTR